MSIVDLFFSKWKYRWLRRRERTHRIEGIPVLLPPGHMLDWYQRLHPRYDRFLPLLARHLDKAAVVLDIGANIGDSAVPFLKQGLQTWCVEPAPEFLTYLKKNLDRNNFSGLAVIIDRLVSATDRPVRLKVERGTAFADENQSAEGTNNTISLDNLIQGMGRVDLVKSDTDGFDHDVLNSGMVEIARHKPLIYFENTVTLSNKDGYEKVYRHLFALGYDQIVLFDNRGNLLYLGPDWSTLLDFNQKILDGLLPDTPYLDVLVGTIAHNELINRVLVEYQSL